MIATNGSPTINNPEQLSAVFRDFLSKALEVEADIRPSAAQLLEHPFFEKAQVSRLHQLALLSMLTSSIATQNTRSIDRSSSCSSQIEVIILYHDFSFRYPRYLQLYLYMELLCCSIIFIRFAR